MQDLVDGIAAHAEQFNPNSYVVTYTSTRCYKKDNDVDPVQRYIQQQQRSSRRDGENNNIVVKTTSHKRPFMEYIYTGTSIKNSTLYRSLFAKGFVDQDIVQRFQSIGPFILGEKEAQVGGQEILHILDIRPFRHDDKQGDGSAFA